MAGRDAVIATSSLGGTGGLLLAALAFCGCAAGQQRPARAASGGGIVLPGPTAGAQEAAADRLGYRAARDALLARLEDAREPEEQARLVLELADLAERTRAAARARLAEIGAARGDRARAEREALGRLDRLLLDEELKLLERVARDFPACPRRDEALYRLAFALLDRDSPDAALEHARTLFGDHPGSPYVPHAYLAFADYYFGKDEGEQAIRLYEKVLAFASPETAPRAHLQLGRCWLAAGEQEKALAAFAAAAAAAQEAGGAAVRDEALAELVKAYVRAGTPEQAAAFFADVAADRIDDLLERLGAAYFAEGRYRDSIAINRQVADRIECSPALARAEVAVFEARLYLDEIGDPKAEGEALVAVFARLTACLPAEDLRELAEAGAAAKESLRNQAERYRREYEFSGEPAAAEMAVELDAAADRL